MRYAIVESGGKQYKAVEGVVIEVDRLAAEEGSQINLERVLFMADGVEFMVGTPTLSEVDVKATVVDHYRSRKVSRFRYSPKKRIRVRGGHRQQYTRLMVDFIGTKGEIRNVAKAALETPKPEIAGRAAKGEKNQGAVKETKTKAAEKKPSTGKTATTRKQSTGSTIKKSAKKSER